MQKLLQSEYFNIVAVSFIPKYKVDRGLINYKLGIIIPIKLRGWDNTSVRVRRKYISGTPHHTYSYVTMLSCLLMLRHFGHLVYSAMYYVRLYLIANLQLEDHGFIWGIGTKASPEISWVSKVTLVVKPATRRGKWSCLLQAKEASKILKIIPPVSVWKTHNKQSPVGNNEVCW